MDLPLSTPFLKLLCQGDVASPAHPIVDSSRRHKHRAGSHPPQSITPVVTTPQTTPAGGQQEDDPMTSSIFSQDGDGLSSVVITKPLTGNSSQRDPSIPWFAGFLSHEDLAIVDPSRGRFLLQLRALATRRRQILTDPSLSHEDRCRQAENLSLSQPNLNTSSSSSNLNGKQTIVPQKIQSAAGQGVRLEDLGLTFQFAPSSKVFGFTDVELRVGGADFEVLVYLICLLTLTELRLFQRLRLTM